jgi:acetylcholinesterase
VGTGTTKGIGLCHSYFTFHYFITQVLIFRAVLMAEKLKCDAGDHTNESTWNIDKILECFHSRNASYIRDKEWVVNGEFLDFPWTPVVDLSFLIEDPITSLRRGHFKNTQLLVGSNREEANFFIVYQLDKIYDRAAMFKQEEFIANDTVWMSGARKLMPRMFIRNPVVRNAIFHEYRDWALPGSPQRRQDSLDKMSGDYFFLCNVNEFAQYYADHGGQVYYFYFTHRASQQTWPKWMGVLHGYEINFIFGEPLNTNDYSYTAEEQALSRKFMRYWANFARTGYVVIIA